MTTSQRPGSDADATRCTFIPPYLLRHLAAADHPTAAVADHPCARTLRIDTHLREQREQAVSKPRARMASATPTDQHWSIYSAGNTEALPGEAVRRDGEPAVDDPAVNEAYAWTEQVLDLYAQEFERRSFDGEGSPVTVTVHFGQDYDNAFWDGAQLVFGDGDGELFERFTKPADVLAHEFSHGVVQYTAGFAYRGQSGALNESMADVFASMSVQRNLGQTADQATWLIGEGLFNPAVKARALRDMLHPGTAYDDPKLGKDPQVGSMSDYVDTEEDDGGVHLNSGIPNRAFALAATGIGGHSWEQAGKVWYAALTSAEVDSTTDFEGFASATVHAADQLFAGTAVPEQVRAAWAEVGVLAPTPGTEGAGTPGRPDEQNGPDPRDQPAPSADPSAPADPSSPAEEPERVAVRRTGGFTGQTRRGEITLDQDPRGPEVRKLLRRVDLTQFTSSTGSPDRFVYTVETSHESVTVGERDLSPELRRVVQIVLQTDPLGPTG